MRDKTAAEDADDDLPSQAPVDAEQWEDGGQFTLTWLPPKRLSSSPASACSLPEAAFPEAVPASDDDRVREELLARHYQEVHQKLSAAFEEVGKVRTLPKLVARGFLSQTPVVSTFAQDWTISCKLRAFLLAVETLGDVTLAAIFFSATSGVAGKKSRGSCATTGDARELFGRLIGICLGSVIIAGIPVSILESLHTRGFKRVPSKEGPEWRRQLRAWRVQDRMIYLVGSVYSIIMLTFMVLFLANISEKDGEGILVAAGISLGQDLIVVPLAIALFSSVMAVLSTALLSLLQGVRRREIILQLYINIVLRGKKPHHGDLST